MSDFIEDARKDATKWAQDLLARDPSTWVILDTETTGLSNKDQVVQVAAIDGAGNVLLDNVLIKPTIRIPHGASQIHGITDETVKDAPSFLEVWPDIYKMLDGKLLVIYNAEFDLRMMVQSGQAHDDYLVMFACDWSDAMNEYANWCGEWSDYHGSFRWQRLPSGDHSALGDCRAVLALINRMAGE